MGWRVIGVDGFTDYYSPHQKRSNIAAACADPNYTLIEDDLLDIDLDTALADVSVVFHLSAQPGVRSSWADFPTYTRQNLDATQRLLAATRGRQIHRVVLASSSSIYGNAETLPTAEDVAPQPVSPYGVTKLGVEHLAGVYWRSFGVPTVCLRYFTVYGPRQRPDMAFHRLISAQLAGRQFDVFGDGLQTRDFTFVSDAVAGTLAAAEVGRPGSAYNIGGGSRLSLRRVLETLATITGQPARCRTVARQPGDARHTAADIRRARSDLGFTPAHDFESGLHAQVEWHRASTKVLSPAAAA